MGYKEGDDCPECGEELEENQDGGVYCPACRWDEDVDS